MGTHTEVDLASVEEWNKIYRQAHPLGVIERDKLEKAPRMRNVLELLKKILNN